MEKKFRFNNFVNTTVLRKNIFNESFDRIVFSKNLDLNRNFNYFLNKSGTLLEMVSIIFYFMDIKR